MQSLKLFFAGLFTLAFSFVSLAQETIIVTMGSASPYVVVCGTPIIFTDDNSGSNDAQDPYSCTNNTITICPDVPGDAVQVNFLNFDYNLNS